MKIKAISRASYKTTSQKGDLQKEHRNLDPKYHPFQKAKEYTRAVTSVKLDRMFAQPFVGSLGNGHRDAISCTATSRKNLVSFVSGALDGEVRIWDLATRKEVAEIPKAHYGIVSEICINSESNTFLSCGYDGKIRQWRLFPDTQKASEEDEEEHGCGPLDTWKLSDGSGFKSMDHHWREDQFATASTTSVDIWSFDRSDPIISFSPSKIGWGDDSVNIVRYNPAESCLLAHCSADRGVGLHDVRAGTSLKKTIMSMKANALEWNPMEPLNFVVANEDYNCYSFDMRMLAKPKLIHRGFVSAVMDISWSPTGREFVAGSYDKTIRIFHYQKERSREIYHLKRMQRVMTVDYSSDNKYIISGSDDSNLRLWKARASESTKQLRPREERALEYRKALVKKYEHMPEVRRINKSRTIPKLIKKQTNIAHIQKESANRKQENVIKHSKPGSVEVKSQKRKAMVKEVS